MYNGKRIIAIIPARGGSQGVKNKNIRILNSKPLISLTIIEALNSKYIDMVFVSTDSEEIAKIAKEYNVFIPFLRPKELAENNSKVLDAIFYSLEKLSEFGEKFEIIILLQPTSPFRTVDDIDNAIQFMFETASKAVVSVCEAEHSPLWSNVLPNDHSMKDFISKNVRNKNRQELPIFYRLNGAVFISYFDYLKKNNGFIGNKTKAFVMPQEHSVDIDTELDFKWAEFLFFLSKIN